MVTFIVVRLKKNSEKNKIHKNGIAKKIKGQKI